MSVIQRDMKHLKEKQKNLEFFLQYLDISKLRLLQILNEEQEALTTLKTIKNANSQLLKKINQNFFKNDDTFVVEKAHHEFDWLNESPETKIYFLVDAKEENEYSDAIYKKMEETISKTIAKNDFVVTFGNRVNLISQKHEFNIIQHFPYDFYLDYDKFIDKVSTLIEVGLKNKVFKKAVLIVAQQNQDNRKLVSQNLYPLAEPSSEEEIFDGTKTIELKQGNISYTTEFVRAQQNSNEDYIDFFHDLNIKKLNWYPNISFFRFKFIKSIIKQNIVELRIIEKIQRLKMELHLLDEKRNKLMDESTIVNRWINRVRKEKSTEATIVLYAAFKLKQNEVSELEVIRKKREQDIFFVNKKNRGNK